MTDQLHLATPERVALELPIAGVGSRAMAWLVDVAILGGVGLALYFALTLAVADPVNAVLALSGTARAVVLGGGFFALWVYWTLLEVVWRGQTPGKRLLRIRVVKDDGAPVTVFASAVRNLMRVIDFLPACYPAGLICMLIDRRHRRLGDLLAGTVLVREEQVDLSRYEQVTATLTTSTLEIATSYLVRFEQLEPLAQLRLGQQIAARLGLSLAPAATAPALFEAIRAHLAGNPHGG